MNTSPKNQSDMLFGAGPRAPRQPRPSERLWTVRTAAGALVHCELRDDGPAGAEIQLLLDGEFVDGRRWPSRAIAVAKGDILKVDHLRCGGTLVD